MSRKSRVVLKTSALLVALSLPALAEAGSKNWDYVAVWDVEPQPMAVEPVVLHKSDVLTTARLLPHTMLVASEDVRDLKGLMIVPTGTPLIGLQSRTPIGCLMKPIRPGSILSEILWGQGHLTCLVDTDGDGKFDRFFQKGAPRVNLISGGGKLPAQMNVAQPASYRRADPATLEDAPRVEIRFGSHAPLVKESNFINFAVNGNESAPFGDWIIVKDKNIPGDFEVMGGMFHAIDQADGKITVKMVRPFVRQEITFLF